MAEEIKVRSRIESMHPKATFLLLLTMVGTVGLVMHLQNQIAALSAKLDIAKVEQDSNTIDVHVAELLDSNKDLQKKVQNQDKQLKKLRDKKSKDKLKEVSDEEVINFWSDK